MLLFWAIYNAHSCRFRFQPLQGNGLASFGLYFVCTCVSSNRWCCLRDATLLAKGFKLCRLLSCSRGCLSYSLWCKHLPSGTNAVDAAQKAAALVTVTNCPNMEPANLSPFYLISSHTVRLLHDPFWSLSDSSNSFLAAFMPVPCGSVWFSGWSHFFLLLCVNMWMYSKLSEKKGHKGFWKAEIGL